MFIGSAAYNLLVISGLCVIAIGSPDIRRIENFTVFLMTAFWSVFAYIWLYLVLSVDIYLNFDQIYTFT